MWTHFYPRSPRGERPFCPIRFSQCSQNFYPRSPRGERPSVPTRADTVQNFYPRSPRGERRIEQPNQHYHQHFYPRSPRGERRCPGRLFAVRCVISIHAPREGSDATSRGSDVCGAEISIHAPREGSDALAEHDVVCFVISIHAPREGSDYPYSLGRIVLMAFLSTLPARGATGATVSRSSMLDYFYPRSPRGERLEHCQFVRGQIDFYPRSPRGERRPKTGARAAGLANFYPRSPRGERLDDIVPHSQEFDISIHAPREGSDNGL